MKLLITEYSESDVPNIIPKSTERLKRKSVTSDIGEEDEDDEFFDANEELDEASSLAKWSSMEFENSDLDQTHSGSIQRPPVCIRSRSLYERTSTTPIDLDPQPQSASYKFMPKPLIDVNQCSQVFEKGA